MRILSDPVWIGIIVTGLVGIIPVLYTFITRFRDRRKKELTYLLRDNISLIQSNEELHKPGLTILFQGKPVKDLSFVTLKLWNSGNVEILPTDFVTPLKIDYGSKAAIDTLCSSSAPSSLGDKCEFKLDTSSFTLKPSLMNKSGELLLSAMVTNFAGKVTVDGLVTGTEIKEYKDPAFIPRLLSTVALGISGTVFIGSIFLAIFFLHIAISYERELTNYPIDIQRYIALSALVILYAFVLASSFLFVNFYDPLLTKIIKKRRDEYFRDTMKFMIKPVPPPLPTRKKRTTQQK